jgi:hypothetical protein
MPLRSQSPYRVGSMLLGPAMLVFRQGSGVRGLFGLAGIGFFQRAAGGFRQGLAALDFRVRQRRDYSFVIAGHGDSSFR